MSSVKKKTRAKAAQANVAVPQTRDEVAAAIAAIGQAITQRARIEADMADAVAALKAQFEALAEPHNQALVALSKGVEIWCAANRAALTENGKRKSATFTTGDVRWRMTPPAVTVRNAEAVIATLKGLGAQRFIRVKEEVNKEAILAEPGVVDGFVPGVSIVQREEFEVLPHLPELAEVVS